MVSVRYVSSKGSFLRDNIGERDRSATPQLVSLAILPVLSMLLKAIAYSGHYTIEACATSQFDAHLRALLGIPIPERSLELKTECAIMLNILGGSTADSHLRVVEEADLVPGATVHMYGKGTARRGRKMGKTCWRIEPFSFLVLRSRPWRCLKPSPSCDFCQCLLGPAWNEFC